VEAAATGSDAAAVFASPHLNAERSIAGDTVAFSAHSSLLPFLNFHREERLADHPPEAAVAIAEHAAELASA
jgi:hypothetical protein